jgi:hypothetical protein
MFKPLKTAKFNANGQDTDNSFPSDPSDEDNGQPSFDSFDQIGADRLDWATRQFGVETSAQWLLGWGGRVAPPAGSVSSDSSSSSVRAASHSAPGGSAAAASTSGLSAPMSLAGAGAGSSPGAVPTATEASGFSSSGGSAIVSTPGSGLVFVNTYESSCTAAFEACIVSAEDELESLFTNSVTLNVTFQEQSSPGSGDALTNNWSFVDVSYANLKAKLHSLDPLDVLPATDPNPAGGNDWALPEAYARMLGLSSSTPSTDDTVTLNTADTGLDDFGQDVINGVIHELSEGAMGRVGGLGDQNGVWSTMDLFRYTAAGVPDYTDGRDGLTTYFSSTGGSETSAAGGGKGAPVLSFNNEYSGSSKVNGGDTADWVQEAVFGSVGGGETLTLNNTELQVMEALGWQLSLTQDVDDSVNNWGTPAEWSTGSMPITPQDALIGGSADATVWLNSNVTVNSISTTAGSSLTIGLNVVNLQEEASACTAIATEGTSLNSADASSVASGNLGTTYVEAGSRFQIGDPAIYPLDNAVTYDNGGALVLGKGAGGVTDGVGVLYLDGTVTLNGAGTVTLGQSGNEGDILNASGTSGDELVNVDNTISGSGFIDLGAFDNQADGAVEAQSFLRISAGAFTNEGAMTAESGATLDLGQDGGVGSLTNTGSISVDGEADLAISGNYTVSGTGYIGFKGAGGEITSDGSGPATFTNESTIYAVATDSATPTGQIGDEGILGSNDLTFDNSGSLIASGAGVTVTLNTGGNTTNDGGGTLEAGNGATLAIDSNVDTGQVNSGSPPGGTIDAASGGTIILSASVADGVSGSSVPGQVVIDGGTFEMLAGSTISVPIEFTSNGGTLELVSPASLVTASGSDGTIDLTGAKVSIAGGNDTIVFVGGSGNVANLSDTAGSPDTVTGSSGSINLTNASISLSGSNDTITAGAGDTISLTSGTGDTFTGAGFTVDAAKGTGLTIGGDGLTGTTDTVSGSNMSVALEAGSHMTLKGSKDTVTISGVSNLTVAGSNDAIAAKKGYTITLSSGTGDTITGSGLTVNAKSAVSSFSLSGSNDAITAGAGDTISLTSGTGDAFTGAGFTIDAAKGTGLTIGGDGLTGTTDTVSGSNVSVALEANSHMIVKGSKDTVTISGVSNLTVAGSNDAVAANKGDTITVNSGTGDTITGSGLTVDAKTAAFKIVGTSDVVYAGLNDTLTDGGSSTLFNIKGNVGALSIASFGADPTGVIDLLGGEGGYTSAGKAFAALTSDGSGGSLLSLGSDGSIDFLGAPKSSLHVTNFNIG